VGDNPVKSKKYTDFYRDSERYNPNATSPVTPPKKKEEEEIPEGYEKDPVTGELRRKSLKDRFAESQRKWDLKQEKQQGKGRVKKALNDMRSKQPMGTDYDEDLFVS
jgi:hypothetical protein